MKAEVRCPNCGTNFFIGKNGNVVTELTDGIHYLVPETIRNENISKKSKIDARMEALKEAGINVEKLGELMNGNPSFKDIFNDDDPIVEKISKGGFINNPELFRRWITAQTFRLLKEPNGWAYAVKKHYDTNYVYRQTMRELKLQIHIAGKKDKRFTFFTFESFKDIFIELMSLNTVYSESQKKDNVIRIAKCDNYTDLYHVINLYTWHFDRNMKAFPSTWLNCFKGAGAYYTLQNIIRTHGFVITGCKGMEDSLAEVEDMYSKIIAYPDKSRRWDILMSLLVKSIKVSRFELKF